MELHVAAAAAAHAPRVAVVERNLRVEEPFLQGENSERIDCHLLDCGEFRGFEGFEGFWGLCMREFYVVECSGCIFILWMGEERED